MFTRRCKLTNKVLPLRISNRYCLLYIRSSCSIYMPLPSITCLSAPTVHPTGDDPWYDWCPYAHTECCENIAISFYQITSLVKDPHKFPFVDIAGRILLAIFSPSLHRYQYCAVCNASLCWFIINYQYISINWLALWKYGCNIKLVVFKSRTGFMRNMHNIYWNLCLLMALNL